MDLTKLTQKNNLLASNEHAFSNHHASIFFQQLQTQMEIDLKFLSQCTPVEQSTYFENARVYCGNYETPQANNRTNSNEIKNYFFLQLPATPGFLIEPEKNKKSYCLYRATKALPLLSNEIGEIRRPEWFILKSKVLEEFLILDEIFVRAISSDKTLSIKQLSETLLLLAEDVRD